MVIKENNLDLSVENVDIPKSFDGTWCLCGWSAIREVVTAIGEKTAQVVNVSCRCKTCVQCNLIEECKKKSIISHRLFGSNNWTQT